MSSLHSESSQAEARAISKELWPSCFRMESELLGVDETSTSSLLGARSDSGCSGVRPPGTIGDGGTSASSCSCGWLPGVIGDSVKPASRLDGEEAVVEVRLYDRYCTYPTAMPANASTVARQPKMMVDVKSFSLELVAILRAGFV